MIIADIALPNVDGCALMQQIRNHEDRALSETPAVALTVLGKPGEKQRIADPGFAGFRQKPVEPADLANDVARLVGR